MGKERKVKGKEEEGREGGRKERGKERRRSGKEGEGKERKEG